jgi:multicomponent Na+:H+ antiporter subunit D
MTWAPPLLVAVPLLTAVVVGGGDHVLPRAVQNALAVAAAAATALFAALLLARSGDHQTVIWFGGWHPRHGIALGVDFTVGPFAAAMCLVIALVVLAALVYSLTYMRDAARLFDALMLVALAGMCGFALSGDLFNLFVWLELTGVAAYALTGFQSRYLGPVQGAVNFAITNSVGSFLLVTGIALVYARTGALNLAQAGVALRGHGDGLVIVAMTLVLCGFLIKAAVVPFHLWAADAYAVAPAPVCAVLGGVMTDIGLFGVARTYWTVFEAPFGGHVPDAGTVLLWLGIVSALLTGVMAMLQRHLKRMLAYSVLSHIGAMLAGIGLLSAQALAGTAVLFVAHAFLTAGLFLVAGVLLVDNRTIDELRLRGRGAPDLGALWLAGSLGLVGAPYLGVYLGHDLLDHAASEAGRGWVSPMLWLASALVGGALLRAWGRIFLGRGHRRDPLLGDELEEGPPERRAPLRPLLVAVAAAVLAVGLVISVVPGLSERAIRSADRFRDRPEYVHAVLFGGKVARLPSLPVSVQPPSAETLGYAIGAVLLAGLLALGALYRRSLPAALSTRAERFLLPPVATLKALHSGVVGDYVTWVVVGVACTGGVWALLLR